MAYEPTVWECGDVVTAELLNKLEQAVAELSEGGSAEPLTVSTSTQGDLSVMDKTWQEIHDAFPNVRVLTSSGDYLNVVGVSEGAVDVGYISGTFQVDSYTADSADGYPYHNNGGN